jgi:3-oxoacyl-[acyl-carrier-protein] synthase II
MDESAIVVTGLGAVTALGTGIAATADGLFAGRVAIGPFALFDASRHRTRLAAQAPLGGPPDRRGPTRADRLAELASREALRHAGLDALPDPARTAVCFGSSNGGLLESEQWYAALHATGHATPARVLAGQAVDAPGQAVARALGVRGPVLTISTACVSASMAIAYALDLLASGEVDHAIAGGADSLCQVTYAGFNSLRAVDPEPSRPFGAGRAGLALGEGAGVLLLERAGSARRRGARALAHCLGAGQTCDAFHMSAPAADGSGAARAIELALVAGGVDAAQVDFVDAHGTGTPLNDLAEAQALRRVFGARIAALPVTSTKALVGHVLGGSGGVEAVATVLCLVHRKVHPTPGDGPIDPATPVDLVRAPRALHAGAIGLSTNLAFGGANTALLFGAEGRT